MLADREEFLSEVRDRLLQAQECASRQYDAHHRDIEFSPGDWVWLCVLHRPAQSLVPGRRSKLSPWFPGPFQIVERMGTVAYRLKLPEDSCIHDVFHIGFLKQFHGVPPTTVPQLPPSTSWARSSAT